MSVKTETDLRAEIEALRVENELLWRAYELQRGCPYMHLDDGHARWQRELNEAWEAIGPAITRREAEGKSLFSEMNAWRAARDREWALRRRVFERDGHQCLACGSTDDLECDHVVPWSRGGKTIFENLQTLCKTCNAAKGTGETDYRLPAPDGTRSTTRCHCNPERN